MKILFSPEYSGHVFIGLNEQHPELMDTMVCDAMGLVAMLELRLGIHVENISGNNRTVLYYKAMSEYMKRNPDNALEMTNQKFIRRFNYIEQHSIRIGKPLKDMTLEEMDALWNEAKALENDHNE